MGTADSERTECGWPDWPLAYTPIENQEALGGRGDLVCSQCVTDCAVRRAVSDIEDKVKCGYCGRSQGPFALDRRLFEYVYRCLGQEYDDPWHGPFHYDKEEDRFPGVKVLETGDLLAEEGSPFAEESAVGRAFENLIEHSWFRLDSYAGEYYERLIWGWDSFEKRLIDGPASLTSLAEAEMGEESAQSLFGFLQEFAAKVDARFVKTCEPGHVLYRARAANKVLRSARRLGSPPPKHTRPQRMSAEGDSCFYAAEDMTTAQAETSASASQRVTVGRWVTTRPLSYADFAAVRKFPNLFDYPMSKIRPFLRFLYEFVERISAPADREDESAKDYLATQELAKYLRLGISGANGHGLDAVRYPSATPDGDVNWVIFGRPDRKRPRRIKLVHADSVSG